MYRSAARLDLQLVLRRRVAVSNLTAVDVATQADRYADLESRSRQPGVLLGALPLQIGGEVVNDGGCFSLLLMPIRFYIATHFIVRKLLRHYRV